MNKQTKHNKHLAQSWNDGSAVQSTFCPSRGPSFGSQDARQEAHKQGG